LLVLSAAQQTLKDPGQPTFRTATDLVTVPFVVRRGSRSDSDLKPLGCGAEAPPVHLTLDLVNVRRHESQDHPPRADQKGRAGFGDAKALQDFAGSWSEAIARRVSMNWK
jgi:hypothetical protein